MASTSKCPYCDGVIRSDEKICPHCGAVNESYIEDTPRTVQQPRTIEELKEYCAERGMPLLRMRFFIGEDYREAKAFGIYREGRNVVVYKNKADGSRAIRYRGPDEEHAVKEIFLKLLDECHSRGIYPDGAPVARSGGSSRSGGKKKRGGGCLSALLYHPFRVFIALMLLGVLVTSCTYGIAHRNDGYFQRPGDDKVYYHYGDDWYYTYDINESGYWYGTNDFPEADYESYSLGDTWSSDWGVSDFRESSTWDDLHSSSSDSDSWDSSSSDYDSWDSGGTDWDSDWD